VVALRNSLFTRAAGTQLDATTRDILATFAGETEDERNAREAKQ
jgi:hypothetical protein